MQSSVSTFYFYAVRLFLFPKPSPVSSTKKFISIQSCRRLRGSFGLASYSALNAIYWIMNLLCSSDHVNSVNALNTHTPSDHSTLTDPGWNSRGVSPCKKTRSQMSACSFVKILFKSRWPALPCADTLLNMKRWIKSSLPDTIFVFYSFWGFHTSGHS